jgi:S-(hydroxymethyl)glutathione dehydrogenase/alcohol dehydrogenase
VGGMTVGVGVPPMEQAVTIAPAVLHVALQKKFVGSLYGDGNPHREVLRIVSLWKRGLLDLESMVTSRRPLDEVNEGFADMTAGVGLRTVLTL